ncbi:hypothetical protein DYB32_009999 [Aphanomyces invadans]|uniref:TRP C-terminal domain-containing protein n=1 Tax=Aphanomyces invadans TaxID=157072 RepID=A0A3R6V4Z5_9STRA|nr:hypothetical protein DYB32_009999 [Aphanomyces invadans]
MRVVLPALVFLASLHASDAAQTCRLSLNVANVANPTQAPVVTTTSPVTTPGGNTTNATNVVVTSPAPTTSVPGGSTTALPSTLKPDKTTLAPPTTIAITTVAVPTTVALTTAAPATTPKEVSASRFLKDSSALPTTTVAPTTTASTLSGKTTPSPATTENATSSKVPSTTVASSTTSTTFGTIVCDETFYGLWAKKGITCGGVALNVSHVLDQECKVYRGTLSLTNSSTAGSTACFSSCYIPACVDKKWDYSDPLGIDSSIYKDLTFSDWFGSTAATLAPSLSAIPTSSFNPSFSCEKYSMCQCPAANIVSTDNSTATNGTTPNNGGTSGSSANDVWSDGSKKTNLDYAGQVTSSVSTSITYTTIAATTTMVIASSVGVVSSSASAAAAGVSTAGSASTAGTTLDIAQFAVCTGALSLPGTLRSMSTRMCELAIMTSWIGASNTLRLVATQMSFSTFTWFSFGDDDKSGKRKLVEEYRGPREQDKGGMFEYTSRLGIKPHMLMYVTLAGVASVLGGVGILLILVVLVGNNLSCVKDKASFRQDCLDRAVHPGSFVVDAVTMLFD